MAQGALSEREPHDVETTVEVRLARDPTITGTYHTHVTIHTEMLCYVQVSRPPASDTKAPALARDLSLDTPAPQPPQNQVDPRLARDLILDPAAPPPHQNQDVLAERLGETIGLALANKLYEVNPGNLQSNPGPNQLSANQPIQAPAPAVDVYHRDWLRQVTDERAKFQETTIRDLIVQNRTAAVPPVSVVQPAAPPATHGCKEEGCDCEATQVELRQDYAGIRFGDKMECCGHTLARHQKQLLA